MELYVYRTPNGYIADFRPYLDGRDHSFEEPRQLPPGDPRWEKIRNLRDPETEDLIGERLEFVGRAQGSWHELLEYPTPWNESFEPAV